MKVFIALELIVWDPDRQTIRRRVREVRDITNAGYEFLVRSAMDPGPTRPPVVSRLGIGWGAGATTPFDRSQESLQAASTSFKDAAWSYDPESDVTHGTLAALWGPMDPSPGLIFVGELAMFNPDGVMVDRTVITPTPKRPEEPIEVHGVLGFAISETQFELV